MNEPDLLPLPENDCITRLVCENEALQKENRDLAARMEELKQQLGKSFDVQTQWLHSEKLASIGQLAAGIAHEINNPVGFVNSNLGTLERYLQGLFEIVDACAVMEQSGACPVRDRIARIKQAKEYDYLRRDVFQLLAESRDGLARVRKIVHDLKGFSQPGGTEWQWIDLHRGLDSTLGIVSSELGHKCRVIRNFASLPEIRCLPSQLNQVFMILLVNAAQSIEATGEIAIRTGHEGDRVWVEVKDTGHGIPREHLNRIFEPFFTTRPVGQGKGLGLSLAYGIVRRHEGRIDVESEVGRGTTFRVVLPVQPASAGEAGQTI